MPPAASAQTAESGVLSTGRTKGEAVRLEEKIEG